MKCICYAVSILLLIGAGVRADPQTTQAGLQKITVNRTKMSPVIDGVFSPGEWSTAMPVHVDAIKPTEAPGLVPWQELPWALNLPDNQDDLSFNIRALYDDNYLYIAIDVADDIIKTGNPEYLWLDDVVEIYLDGDQKSPDDWGITAFQLDTTATGETELYPDPDMDVNWTSAAGIRPRGYLVETRVSLASIHLSNGEVPGPGSQIGFNVTVGDNDTGLIGDPWFDLIYGGDPNLDDGYFHIPDPTVPGNPPFDMNNWFKNTPSSFLAWDGNSAYWLNTDASAWGTLYFAR